MNNTVEMLSEKHFSMRAESSVVALSPSSPPSLQDSTATTANSSEKPKANFCHLEKFSGAKNVWRVLKCITFIACASFFTYQATETYMHYYTYPTRINIDVVKSNRFKMPAITFCNRNLVKRTYFCGQYPHLCSKPNNLKAFCWRHPYMCRGDTKNLVIPMVGYYTNSSKDTTFQIQKSLQELVRTSKEVGFNFFPVWEDKRGWEETYSRDYQGMISYPRCYSKYLPLFNKDTQTILRDSASLRVIPQKREEYLFPWYASQVFLLVHSPFTPAAPMDIGNKLMSRFKYKISIELEEEHLLPAPYATNCTDYETLWLQNNKTGPRSYQMCRDLCWWKYGMDQYGCILSPGMFAKWDNVCLEDNTESFEDYYWNIYMDCRDSCKSDCLHLKYTYTVTESPIESFTYKYGEEQWSFEVNRDIILLSFDIKNSDVTVISHVPLYGGWELFSYIGGLVGCWLGISVWALVGIGEKTLQKSVRYVKKLMKRRKKTATASIDSKEHSF